MIISLSAALTLLTNSLISAPVDFLLTKSVQAEISAYTAHPAETDDTPNITASGAPVFNGLIANNCLPFGSLVMVQNKVYAVFDRMNPRYDCNAYDIFMPDKKSALEWGRRKLEVKILK